MPKESTEAGIAVGNWLSNQIIQPLIPAGPIHTAQKSGINLRGCDLHKKNVLCKISRSTRAALGSQATTFSAILLFTFKAIENE